MGRGLAAGPLVTAWRYAKACVPGTSHLRAGMPCQDHGEVAPVPALGEAHALIAVACDGAGSATHADEGARASCAAFLEYSRLALGWVCGAEYLNLTGGFGQQALSDLRDQITALAKELNEPISAFACTLLGAIVTQDSAIFVQLGDGAIAFRTARDGPWRLAAQMQRGEFINETVFVTRRDANRYIQAVRVDEPVHEFALMTDGVELLAIKHADARPHAAFFEHVIAGLREISEPGEVCAHNIWIQAFLESDAVNQRTDDDKTLILATRVPVSDCR